MVNILLILQGTSVQENFAEHWETPWS